MKYFQVPSKVGSQRQSENKQYDFRKLNYLKHGLDSESRHLTTAVTQHLTIIAQPFPGESFRVWEKWKCCIYSIEAAVKWIVCSDFYPYHEPEILEWGKPPACLPPPKKDTLFLKINSPLTMHYSLKWNQQECFSQVPPRILVLRGFSASPQTAWKPLCGCLLPFRPSAPYLFGLQILILCQEPILLWIPQKVVKSEMFGERLLG